MKTDTGSQNCGAWRPLAPQRLDAIYHIFSDIFPAADYNDLARQIADCWIDLLRTTWAQKPASIKARDMAYDPAAPLSRIQQKTVVIAYADSVFDKGTATLPTLDRTLVRHFSFIGGLHLLPACVVAKDRFNDGFFSQVERDRIDPAFGSNQLFADMVEKYFSMTDFVLNHVDIENPIFKAYLEGDDAAGRCFYVFSESEYEMRRASGDFEHIFRPRPFPLFTIFRRTPRDQKYAKMSDAEKTVEINLRISPDSLPEPVVDILSVFYKIKNDQMLLETDYQRIIGFRKFLSTKKNIDPDRIFTLSTCQETQHLPWIFRKGIASMADLLTVCGFETSLAKRLASSFETHSTEIFGEEIRALTTFSHVQVDLNTGTFEGLELLAKDFCWYLGMDLNLLRLDAANFAFKKWGTSCFGLPEVKKLMQILFLSMECVAPRMVANLEVNDRLGAVLEQMSDPDAPPPMMYDFHLASLLPVVFNSQNADILGRIPRQLEQFTVPESSIRFSVTETHDGKSVRGSLDLLRLSERLALAGTVEKNGGRIKYKSVPKRKLKNAELAEFCEAAGLTTESVQPLLFDSDPAGPDMLTLKDRFTDEAAIADALGIDERQGSTGSALRWFIDRVLNGRDAYELCCSTADALVRIESQDLEVQRFLAFHTLAFAMMGRNVKSIYFNDLFALPNDHKRIKKTGELRDIKRTRSDIGHLERLLSDPLSPTAVVADGINRLIAIVDNDPALSCYGDEAKYLPGQDSGVAVIHNHANDAHTLTVVNLAGRRQTAVCDFTGSGWELPDLLFDNILKKRFRLSRSTLTVDLQPYQRLWLTPDALLCQSEGQTAISEISRK